MKVILVILVFNLQLIHAETLEQWEKSVVKINSFPCDTKAPVFSGSGIIVNDNNQLGVLSSDHVFYQSKSKDTCVEIKNDWINLNIETDLTIDFINGLAWVGVQDKSLNQFAVSVRGENTDLPGSEVAILGYNMAENILSFHSNGRVNNLASQRAIIPTLEQVYEVNNLMVRPGMSGGPLVVKVSENDFEFAGLVSHRDKPKVKEVKSDTKELKWVTLAIPQKHVNVWLDQKSNTDFFWKRNQVENGEQLSYDKLNFQVKGHDIKHFAMGGADGSGVGGDDDTKTIAGRKMVTISIDRGTDPDFSVFEKYPVLKKWSEYILQGKKVYILQMAKKVGDTYSVKPVTNLEQVMTLWLRDSYNPVVFIDGFQPRGVKSNLQKRLETASSLDKQITFLSKNLTDSNLKKWLAKMKQIALLYANFVADKSDINKFNHAYQVDIWKKIYDFDFDLAVELERTLLDLTTK